MRRLTAKMVRSGLVTAWRFAGWPTSRSPSSVKATMDGVVRMPSAFSMTFGVLPSITATQEFVVPRSIPMTLPMVQILSLVAGRAGPEGALNPTPYYCQSRQGNPRRLPLAHIGGRHRPARQDCRWMASSTARPVNGDGRYVAGYCQATEGR